MEGMWAAIIAGLVGIITLWISNLASNKREERQAERERNNLSMQNERLEFERKERYISRLLSKREESNSLLFVALVNFQNYLFPYVNPGFEFKESKDIDEFACLGEVEKIQLLVDSVEIWIHKDTVLKMKELDNQFNFLNNIAFNLALEKSRVVNEIEDEIDILGSLRSSAISLIEETLVLINDMKEHIRKQSGGEALDKYVNRVIS